MRRAHRVDATHTAIRQALEGMGLVVLDVSSVPNLGADFVCIHPATKRALIVEAKNGALAPSKRKLTDSEVKLAFKAPRVYRVVGSVDEALKVARELAA